MITLLKLLNFAKRHGLDPGEVTIILRQPCGFGPDQHDFLVEPKIVWDTKALSLEDEFIPVPIALTLEILSPPDEEKEEEAGPPGPFDDLLKGLKEIKEKDYPDPEEG